MHVTKWGEYGILCSVLLARRFVAAQAGEANAVASGTVGAIEVAQEQGIPAQYTQQILQRVRRGGVVKSVRGARGGYILARPPSEITLLDIMKAAEGSTFDLMCETSPAYPSPNGPHECGGAHTDGGCNLKEVWLEVRSAIDDVLTRRTLASLLKSNAEHALNSQVSKLIQITPVQPAGEPSR